MKTSESIGAWPVLSVWGKAAALASELAPGAVAAVQRIANRAMPKADLTKGDFRARDGRVDLIANSIP